MRLLFSVFICLFYFTVSSQQTYVPDDNFEAYLETHDASGNVVAIGASNSMGNGITNDDYVTTSNVSVVTNLDVNNQNIADLTGIEEFTALSYLNCRINQLTSLNVTQNTALTNLNCYNNQLTSLDVTQNTALKYLWCYYNQLTSLDVTQNTALTVLYCHNNQLTSLDVTQNTALTNLYCFDNQLTSLDVTQNTALTFLDCEGNQLTNLDVSNNTALTSLYCGGNPLTSLDVSQHTALTSLVCYNNQLTSLDVSQNTALHFLICWGNQLTSLDVSQHTALTILNCHNNRLTSLDLRNGNNTNFTDFNTTGNSNLNCISVDDVPWATTNWTNIDAHTSFSNDCANFNNANAGKIYVSKTGNNSTGDGSSSNPYLTVQHAVDQASVGDSIIIGAGTFEEEITVNTTLNFRGNGVESTKLYLDVANYQYKKLMWVRSDTVSVSHLTMSSNCDFNNLLYADTSFIEANYVLFEQTDSTEGMGSSYPIFNKNGTSIISNCTFLNTTVSQWQSMQATAIYLDNGDSLSVINSIFYLDNYYYEEIALYSNGQPNYHSSHNLFWGYNDHLKYYDGSSTITTDLNGTNSCIEHNPDFVSPNNNNFNLLWYSPAVDAGDPSILDADGSISDMGALPFVKNNPEVSSPYITGMQVNPNAVFLDIQITNDSDIDSLYIYRATNNNDTTFYNAVEYTGANYTDNNVTTYVDYWYLAKAKSNGGHFSYYSNRVFANPHDSILEVPQEFATIQLALDTAYPGDVVLVDDGTYQENLLWPQIDNVTMRSVNGKDLTIINGSDTSESCLYAGNSQKNIIVDGFTFRNGSGSIAPINGASFGGAIQFYDDVTGELINSNIIDNGGLDVYGGAVFIGKNSLINIENCYIKGNLDQGSGQIYYRNSTGTVKNCVIITGGEMEINGIYLQNSYSPMEALQFQSSEVEFVDNTVITTNINRVIYSYYKPAKIINNIFYGNFSSFLFTDQMISNEVSFNNIFSVIDLQNYPYKNTIRSYNGTSGTYLSIVGQNGNFSLNPLFADTINYELTTNSPCINSGNPDFNYNDPDGTRADVGANYYSSALTYVPDDNFEYYLETHNLSGNIVPLGSMSSLGDGLLNNDYVYSGRIASLTSLDLSNQGSGLSINDLTGISDFISLQDLNISQNNIDNLNVSSNLQLDRLYCANNGINSIDLSQNSALNYLSITGNPLFSLNLTNNINLDTIVCDNTGITSLDLSSNNQLSFLNCMSSSLYSLDLRNGNNLNISYFNTTACPNLSCINVDDPNWSSLNWPNIDAQTIFSNNCAIPQVDFDANTTNSCIGSNITFTDASGGNPISWSWDFGDGNTSTLQNPTHSYSNSGTYDVSLIVTNNDGANILLKTAYINVIFEHFNYGGTTEFCLESSNAVTNIIGNTGGLFTSNNPDLSLDSLTGLIYLSDYLEDYGMGWFDTIAVSSLPGNYQITYTPPSGFQKMGQDLDGLSGEISCFKNGDGFGAQVDLNFNGDTLVVRNSGEGANDGGVVDPTKIFDWDGNHWQLNETSTVNWSWSGNNYTTFSYSGNIKAVSTIVPNSVNTNIEIFILSGFNWNKLGQTLTGSSYGGTPIDLNAAGDRLLIGGSETKLYEYNGSQWIQIGGSIYGENSNDQSGYSVSLNGAGDILAIGAPSNINSNGERSGNARVYKVSSGFSCPQTINVTIHPSIVLDLGPDTTICYGNNFIIDPGAGFSSYLWDDGSVSQTRTVNTSGVYFVTVNDVSTGCSKSDTILVGINNYKISAGSNQTILVGDTVQLTATGTQTFQWNTGETTSNILKVPTVNTNFIVTGIDPDGCIKKDTVSISVSQPSDAFSYGGDTVFCQTNDNPVPTILADSGGIFSSSIGLFIDSITGEIDLSLSNIGNYEINYTIKDWNKIGEDITDDVLNYSENSIDINSSGDRVIVGYPSSNKAKVFQLVNNNWIQMGSDIDGFQVTNPGVNWQNGQTGKSVGINGLGNIIIVGSPAYDSYNGRIRMFQWNGTEWIQKGSDINGFSNANSYNYRCNEQERGHFGFSVSINDDGNRIIAGGPYIDLGGKQSGYAEIFQWNGTEWDQMGSSLIGDYKSYFGSSLSINGKGDRIIIGAKNYNNSSGFSRVFQWDEELL